MAQQELRPPKVLVVRSAAADVDHWPVLGALQPAADDFGQEDAVIARVDVLRRLALQVAKCIFKDRHAAGAMGDFHAFERRVSGLEALIEMS